MIFVATGTQFPFDRLIQYMDEWAEANNEDVFAQIGDGEYEPKHAKWQRFLSMDEYNAQIKSAEVFVSHAGMGNIISGRDNHIPTIVINRQAKLGEHRNDHQADGIVWMDELDGVYAVTDKTALFSLLDQRASLSSKASNNSRLSDLVGFIDTTLTGWK